MKLIKNILFGAAFIAAGAAFAQQSMTDVSTSGLFGTDVDDFMNVNEYHNVQPENLFAYLGYERTGNGEINIGAAHQFKKLYLGSWFGGTLNDWYSSTTFDKDGKATINNNTGTSVNTANGKLLFGINNMGILADVSFTPKSGNKYEKTPATKTEETANKFILKTDVKLGMNIGGKNDRVYKTWALLGLDSNVDKYEKKIDGKIGAPTDKTDKSKYTIKVGAGTYFDYLKKDALTYGFGIGLNTDWDINVNRIQEKKIEHGEFEGRMNFDPNWTVTYEPSSRFAFKTKIGLNGDIKFNTGKDYTDNDGTKNYEANRDYTTGFKFQPSLALGTTYQVVPEKFSFNAGVEFKTPKFGWDFTKKDTRNPSSGSVDSSTFGVTYEVKTSTGMIGTSSGFTWMPTKNVTVDANWNLLNNLFDKFRSNLDEGSGTSIWNTANKIFVHNFGFLVSVKL